MPPLPLGRRMSEVQEIYCAVCERRKEDALPKCKGGKKHWWVIATYYSEYLERPSAGQEK